MDVEQVISRIKETCPEKPEVTMDVELHRPDGSFIYELRLRSLWTKEETSTYTGTIGVAKIKSGKKMGGGGKTNYRELYELVVQLKKIFDVVRLVDVDKTEVVMPEQSHACYAVWNRQERCENCISARVVAQRCQLTKIEFVDSKIYLVISHYVEIDGKGYALEMVTEIRDELLFGAYGRSELIEKIEQYNNKIYRDPLSGAFNRRYYEEQACHMVYMDGVAMIDADDFKEINDKYGHMVGDLALKAYTEGVFSVIRSTDILIRYGGDEFVLLINHVLKDVFIDKLERICKAVSAKKVEGYPQIQLSVSIGGVYKGGPVKTAIVLADSEMYKIKKLKNSVSVYEGGE